MGATNKLRKAGEFHENYHSVCLRLRSASVIELLFSGGRSYESQIDAAVISLRCISYFILKANLY